MPNFSAWLADQPPFNSSQEIDRLRINHSYGTFDLPDYTPPPPTDLDCVILGLIHQRVMFSEDRKGIPCKSPNGIVGVPSLSFPWELSNFDIQDYPQKFQGFRELSCETCKFKEFDTDLKGGKAPACSEQYTLPLFYNLPGSDVYRLAIFSVQKTAIKPTKTYLTQFQREGRATYTNVTHIRLNKVGSNNRYWSLPEYEKGSNTPSVSYVKLSQFFRTIREIITSPPVVDRTGKVVHSQIKYRHKDSISDLIA